MHCKAEQQKIMAKLFKEILKDLYILDDVDPPQNYPTPEELKGKFIIEEGREKIPLKNCGTSKFYSRDVCI